VVERRRRLWLNIEVGPDLRRRLKIAAARRNLTVQGFVLAAVEQALQAEDRAGWSGLSGPSFARDWDSAPDTIYDHV